VAEENDLTTSEFPDMSGQIVFLRSFSEQQRQFLFERCACVVYTPSNEHFGIVPIEAMYASRPVIAVNNGGPLESVRDGETGYLREGEAMEFASAMIQVASNLDRAKEMGKTGRQHVIDTFSLTAFTDQLEGAIFEFTS